MNRKHHLKNLTTNPDLMTPIREVKKSELNLPTESTADMDSDGRVGGGLGQRRSPT
jgi:hypothetical protein